jgi:hypothetical protein
MTSLRRIAVGIALQLLTVLVLLEVTARVVDPIGISYYPESARFFDWLVRDSDGYRLPPNRSEEFYGALVETNRYGLRGSDFPRTPEPGERRILVLGDSVPFGIGVTESEAIPAQLEAILNANYRESRYRVVNMGVPSYNTEAELDQLDDVGLGLHPDLAVLLYTENDIESRLWVFEKRESLAANWAQRSYAISLAFVGARALLSRDQREAGKDPRYAPDHERWLGVRGSLEAMHARLRAKGVPFVVMPGGGRGMAFVERISEVGAARGFPVQPLDLANHPILGTAQPGEYTNSVVDGHCNPRGCRLIAERIFDLLAEVGFVPIESGNGTMAGESPH